MRRRLVCFLALVLCLPLVAAEPTLQETKDYIVEKLNLLGEDSGTTQKFEGNTLVVSSSQWVIRVPIADLMGESVGCFSASNGLGFFFKGINSRKVIKVDGRADQEYEQAHRSQHVIHRGAARRGR